MFPSNLTSGNWKVGVVVDQDAGDDVAQAVEREPLRASEGQAQVRGRV